MNTRRGSTSYFLIAAFLIGTIVGGIVVYAFASQEITGLRNDVAKLSGVVSDLSGFQNVVNETVNVYQNGTALSKIYSQVKDSIVLVLGQVTSGYVLGSGFAYNASGTMVIVTNNHVVNGTSDLSVTFSDGEGYAATVLGTDPYSDLAVLSVNAPQAEFLPLSVVSSADVNVGDSVIAVGNPYGLIDSATMGIVSGTGRTMTESQTGNVVIANVIQMSAPINPGNSGGPLLNYLGNVIGITTATVSGSDALGFAIPSDTILKEVESLALTGSYLDHSDLGAVYVDNDYLNAQQLGTTTTWGAVITDITPGGPADGILNIDDVIMSANGTRIQGGDELAAYLNLNTLPGDSLDVGLIRQGTGMTTPIILGRLD
jgi:S1-C subfamily serine protease